jgi:hypothetical protein
MIPGPPEYQQLHREVGRATKPSEAAWHSVGIRDPPGDNGVSRSMHYAHSGGCPTVSWSGNWQPLLRVTSRCRHVRVSVCPCVRPHVSPPTDFETSITLQGVDGNLMRSASHLRDRKKEGRFGRPYDAHIPWHISTYTLRLATTTYSFLCTISTIPILTKLHWPYIIWMFRTVAMFLILNIQKPFSQSVYMVMLCLHSKFHTHSSNGSLVTNFKIIAK